MQYDKMVILRTESEIFKSELLLDGDDLLSLIHHFNKLNNESGIATYCAALLMIDDEILIRDASEWLYLAILDALIEIQ